MTKSCKPIEADPGDLASNPEAVPARGRKLTLTAIITRLETDLVLSVYPVGKRSRKGGTVKGYFSLDVGPHLRLLSGRLLEREDGKRFISPPGFVRQIRNKPTWTNLWRFMDRDLEARVLEETEKLLVEADLLPAFLNPRKAVQAAPKVTEPPDFTAPF